jgi:hypothetical protein
MSRLESLTTAESHLGQAIERLNRAGDQLVIVYPALRVIIYQAVDHARRAERELLKQIEARKAAAK